MDNLKLAFRKAKKGSVNLLEKNLKQMESVKAAASFEGWLAYAIHANSYKDRKTAARMFSSLFAV